MFLPQLSLLIIKVVELNKWRSSHTTDHHWVSWVMWLLEKFTNDEVLFFTSQIKNKQGW